jgi:transposase
MKEQIIALRKEGLTYRQIQEQLGCSLGTITYYLTKGRKQKEQKRFKERAKAATDLLTRWKRTQECNDCGFSFKEHPSVCDLHHVDPELKKSTVRKLAYSSIKKMKEEIRKCIPLCANCHRIRHSAEN